MKNLIFTSVFLLSSFFTFGQITSASLLSELPNIPSSDFVCSADSSSVKDFYLKIASVKEKIKLQIKNINYDAENRVVDVNSTFVYSSHSKGFITINELSSLSKMNMSEREKWLKDYVDRRSKGKGEATVLNLDNTAAIANLKAEQKEITKVLQYSLDKQRSLLQEIEALYKAEVNKMADTSFVNYSGREAYCKTLSEAQLKYITQCYSDINNEIPLYIRLNEIDNDLIKREINYEKLVTSTDLFAVKAVSKYADILITAYKYWPGNL